MRKFMAIAIGLSALTSQASAKEITRYHIVSPGPGEPVSKICTLEVGIERDKPGRDGISVMEITVAYGFGSGSAKGALVVGKARSNWDYAPVSVSFLIGRDSNETELTKRQADRGMQGFIGPSTDWAVEQLSATGRLPLALQVQGKDKSIWVLDISEDEQARVAWKSCLSKIHT